MKPTDRFRRPKRATNFPAALCGTFLTLVFTSGCKEERIETYEVAKESVSAALDQGAAGHSHPEAAGTSAEEAASALTWRAPPAWKEKPASAMRRATFAVPLSDGSEADLGVTVLGGAAGGLAANVNRWRTQLGLSEIGADQVSRIGETVTANGVSFALFDLAGNSNGGRLRMLAAVGVFEGQSWFFKLVGSDEPVAAQKPAFVTFLRSVQAR